MLLGATPRVVSAQERGAIALGQAVAGLGVSARVLMVGAHPDDEDTFLIAWLSRGRHVRTGYLSLTRGDGGQNLIGNELGEALGVIRTEELLAARRLDGGEQYFTRAFDFGFSKDTIDTYAHWPKDSILGDVVRVVRFLRPHVIVAVFSGTPRDGHGHHQVSGLLAREAYNVAADTLRFPVATHGAPWTPLKFYRAARFNAQAGTLAIDVGEYSPLLGRSYAEVAGESRSQHKSQGFGAPQPRGRLLTYLRREATRVNDETPAATERSLFDGMDTSWARFRAVARVPSRLDSLGAVLAAARGSFDAFAPERSLPDLFAARRLLAGWRFSADPDFAASIEETGRRVERAIRLASGVLVDATAREAVPNDSFEVVATIYNRGRDTVRVGEGLIMGLSDRALVSGGPQRVLPPGGMVRDTLPARAAGISMPWWLGLGNRAGAVFSTFGGAPTTLPENLKRSVPKASYVVTLPDSEQVVFSEVVVNRFVDDVRGEVERPISIVPPLAISVNQSLQYVAANRQLEREIEVRLTSADSAPRTAEVVLSLPAGLTADGTNRVAVLGGYGATAVITFHLRGRLRPGEHRIAVIAESNGERFSIGYTLIDYDHIEPRRIYRRATIEIVAVPVQAPGTLHVAYVEGVSDNVAPALRQLGVPVTLITASELARADLSRFTTLVIGPRAYDAHPELVAANTRVLEFARAGGTVVVQYGQYEMTQQGIMPFPITINRPHDRVAHEDAPVTLLDSAARELSWPNRITSADFDGWVQERSLYMPRTFDASYRALLALSDPGEPPNRGGILVARIGRGTYIYTSMAFFRQLPAGVPGAARLFVNLLSAGLPITRTP